MNRRPIRYRYIERPATPSRLRQIWQAIRPLLTWRVLAGAFVVACFLLMFGLGVAWLTRPPTTQTVVATAVLQVIHAATSTPTGSPASAGGPAAPGEDLPTPPPGVIAPGAYVQVTGTGGDGLRLRDAAGLNGKVILVGSEAEVFRVQEGPQELDGYTWWYLVGPFDDQRRGWAVVNYLQVVQKP
jgi:hypothetical protein